MSTVFDETIASLSAEQPRMSDALKNLISIMAGQDLVPPAEADGAASKPQQRRPHEMQHLLACAKVVLKTINDCALPDPSEWASAHPQGAEEAGGDRIAALTAYKACHAMQAHAASQGAKVTKLLGRSYLRHTSCWADGAAAAAERELTRLRFPQATVKAFLEGFSNSLDVDDDFASLVWARDFAGALDARRRARSQEVHERRERMQSGESEAQALREALAAQEDAQEDGAGGDMMDTQESRVEEVLEAI